jgi:hypothetical protein
LGKKTGLPYLSEAKNMQVINKRTWKKVSTAKGEAGKPDPKAVDPEGERIEADVRDLSEAKNMWIKNIHIDIESICKRGRGNQIQK